MSGPIRVMLCDDSSIMRRLIAAALRSIKDVAIVCEAVDGRDALEKLAATKPDVLVMDVQMPVMDGIEAVKQLRKTDRRLPVIMFSSLTTKGGHATIDAISAGANDVVTKPTEMADVSSAVARLRSELLPKIYEWTRPKESSPAIAKTASASNVTIDSRDAKDTDVAARTGRRPGSIEAIGIGVSTGGPQTLTAVIGGLPKQLTVPILVVQHMPATFTGLLAERLANAHSQRVFEGSDGHVVQPGDIIIAPGDYHLTVVRQKGKVITRLDQKPRENSCRPAVDPLFRSMASCYGNRCLGVVLTGMGKDGTSGAAALRERGACILVQDKATSVVWGMPGSVVQHGLADLIVPRDQIAMEITRAIGNPVVTQRS